MNKLQLLRVWIAGLILLSAVVCRADTEFNNRYDININVPREIEENVDKAKHMSSSQVYESKRSLDEIGYLSTELLDLGESIEFDERRERLMADLDTVIKTTRAKLKQAAAENTDLYARIVSAIRRSNLADVTPDTAANEVLALLLTKLDDHGISDDIEMSNLLSLAADTEAWRQELLLVSTDAISSINSIDDLQALTGVYAKQEMYLKMFTQRVSNYAGELKLYASQRHDKQGLQGFTVTRADRERELQARQAWKASRESLK